MGCGGQSFLRNNEPVAQEPDGLNGLAFNRGQAASQSPFVPSVTCVIPLPVSKPALRTHKREAPMVPRGVLDTSKNYPARRSALGLPELLEDAPRGCMIAKPLCRMA
jgi:hypothetical protein